MKRRGNCYATCEALYHLLGGKNAGWKSFHMYHEGQSHWFLECTVGAIYDRHIIRLDPTVYQFKVKPDYSKAKGKGFLTKQPSKRAKKLMDLLIYQDK